MEEEVKIVIRPFDAPKDQAMIYATWRNSSWYSSFLKHHITANQFFKTQTFRIKNILDHANIRIACLEDAPEVIIGYCVYTGSHLDWIYVKSGEGELGFRQKGIATLLVPRDIKTFTSQLTKIGKIIADKKNLKLKENE